MLVIKHHSYYRRCKTTNRGHSVDVLLMLIFRMWLGPWVCVFCISRRLILRKWTVMNLCKYFVMNSSISECDHTCETRNTDPEILAAGFMQTRRNPPAYMNGSGIGPWSISGSGFGTGVEHKQLVFTVQTRTAGGLPWTIANINFRRPNHDPYPSTCRFSQVWVAPSVVFCCSDFQGFLFLVVFRYPIDKRKILTLVCRSPFLMYWPPL